jgi:hypothetical protein
MFSDRILEMRLKQHQAWRKGFPYYKVQYWDYKVSAWHDIQKLFKTEAEARRYGITLETRYRVMKITREGRKPV